MEAKILLGKILKTFKTAGHAQVPGYNQFTYLRETENMVVVGREKGKDTNVPFKKILIGIEAYQSDRSGYDKGPTWLRTYGLTHLTSPIFALLHLLKKEEY
ncbi:hypothetical protein [uncultured Imperialibacter sp.]|uniref:hypothetical protein n=1 Tax=uncultured Imperialibacter sp. TaxID=1672639 RepID=UPI0030DA8BEF|tara:strand:- start:358 stop:660 length:303 start_codon:yes stop_codon:yes gene_type:complete